MSNEEIQSKIILFLRYPLMIGVIAIHAYSSYVSSMPDYYVFNHIQYLISQIIGRVSVPLFFFFSGYLYFYKVIDFTKSVYLNKSRKRIKSLLIPYLFCITLALFFHIYISSIDELKGGITLSLILRSYWNLIDDSVPIVYSMWFLRDLIILSALSPVIWILIRKTRFVIILLLFCYWYSGMEFIPFPGFRSLSLFFFFLGAYFSIHKITFINIVNKVPIYVVLIAFVIFTIVDLYNLQYNMWINKTAICLLMIIIIRWVKLLVNKHDYPRLYSFSALSFFTYLYHEPLLGYIWRFEDRIIHPDSDMSFLFLYCSTILLVVFITFCVYFLLMKLVPSVLNFITGRR